jgi:hypothetical protein
MKAKNKFLTSDRLTSILFYLAILIFLIGFNFSDNRAGGWTQQFMPNIGTSQISDMFFIDSLNGWAVAYGQNLNDTGFILKTTNKGDNWAINRLEIEDFTRVQFLNQNVGYVGGYDLLYKTTNTGNTWNNVNLPHTFFFIKDMSILNEDSMWVVDSDDLTGGVFFTPNGGVNWQRQYYQFGANPDRIYMYNKNMGFICNQQLNTSFYRTSNGGDNWTLISNNESFNDMYFMDSLTGWKSPPMKKTTDGGLNWVEQMLPSGGNLVPEGRTFSNINGDSIWAGGGYKFFPGSGNRAILFFTSNGGGNWYFQLPDTSFGIANLPLIQFTDRRIGWAYMVAPRGIHTVTGGNDTFFTAVKQISSEVPKEYKLIQNYPNPFNPITKIKAFLSPSQGGKQDVKLVVYDITGKEIAVLLEGQLSAGEYEVNFDGSNYSSGIYFYSLIVDGKLIDTKKMILLK